MTAAVRVHADEGRQFSVRTAQQVQEDDFLVEFGGEVLDWARSPDSRPTIWFLAIVGFHRHYVIDGARRGEWPLTRYLNERKVGSFVNSSQTVSGTNNYIDSNAVIEWEYGATPQQTRAVLRAKRNMDNDVEILWNYPWV